MTQKLTLDDMMKAAAEHGGKCLSESYVNSKSKLDFECAQGHAWSTTPQHIRQGHWCGRCAKGKLNLDTLREAALSRGGKCLFEVYVDAKTKGEWECARGHRWLAAPNNVLNVGNWCPTCATISRRKIPDRLAKEVWARKAASSAARVLEAVRKRGLVEISERPPQGIAGLDVE